MSAIGWTVFFGIASWLAWAACVTYVVVALRRRFPSTYKYLGAPSYLGCGQVGHLVRCPGPLI